MEDQFIGSYRVLKKIGAGGTAQVYLAVHQDVPSLKVILKILSDERLGERFRHEADKLALLDGHAGICRIKHFFTHADDTVIAMEYIDGLALDQHIKEEKTLPLKAAVGIAREVLDILDFAHRKGICHRDIKPSNIMVDSRGQTKIIDFGIAKAETDPNLTAVGTACGTPTYMAPEQFSPTEDTNYQLVDIYAVGCTLYAMLTGKVPFSGDNPFAIRDAKLFEDPPSPRFANPEIPEGLEQVILKALSRDPAERYQTAREMMAALEPFVDGPGGTTSPGMSPDDATLQMDTPVTPTPTPASPKGKKKAPMVAIGISIVVVVAIAIYWTMSGDGSSGSGGGSSSTPIETDTAAIDTIPAMVALTVSMAPNGNLFIDDSAVASGQSQVELEHTAGRHVIRVENARSTEKRFVDTVYLTEGYPSEKRYEFTIPAPPKPKPKPAMGEVRVGSRPLDAAVYIDGKRQQHLTMMTFEVAAGSHHIRVEKTEEGVLLQADTTVVVKADSLHKVNLILHEK